MCPPRTIANESALLKYDVPGSSVTVSLPALIRSGSISASLAGYGPTPSMPFSECSVISMPGGMQLADQRRHADAEVHVVAVAADRARCAGRCDRAYPRVTFFSMRLSYDGPLHDALHEDARRVDAVGLERAGLDQLLDLGDGVARRRGHHRIEVARRSSGRRDCRARSPFHALTNAKSACSGASRM